MPFSRLAVFCLAAMWLAACTPAPEATKELPPPDAAAIEAHMAYLASDELEGREAGTPGYDLAADYVAKQFTEMGLSQVFHRQAPLNCGPPAPESGSASGLSGFHCRSAVIRVRDGHARPSR